MIGMGAKSITTVRAVMADFLFDCRAAERVKEKTNENQAIGRTLLASLFIYIAWLHLQS
jgi:hypothetical protein